MNVATLRSGSSTMLPMARLTLLLALCTAVHSLAAQSLSGTEALTWDDPLDVRMMEGAHRFIERRIADSVDKRQRHWHRDGSNYEVSIAPNRRRFIEKIGAVDPLPSTVTMERFGEDDNGPLAETKLYRIYQIRWPAVDGVQGEGLLMEPLKPANAFIVALPDADQTPEQIAGLSPGLPPERQFAKLLAEHGCAVLIPTLVSRESTYSGRPDIQMTDQPHREWLYRQAFHMGRHVIGYEVQKVRAAIQWSRQKNPKLRTGVAGFAEGGLIAFYAAAADTRIDAALVSGYFDNRQRVWSEPIFRNVWGLLEEFGDAEIATLVAPRGLVVEQAEAPEFRSTKGDIVPILGESVHQEFTRIAQLLPHGLQQQRVLARMDGVTQFLKILGVRTPPIATAPRDRRLNFDGSERQRRTVKQIEDHVQRLVAESEQTRAKFFLLKAAPYLKDGAWSTKLRHPTYPAGPFIEAARPFRDHLSTEVIGRFDDPLLPPAPRTRKIYDREKWTGYDVVLDVFPDVFAWGILLIPKDLRAGERRPVVVSQHGRHGLPKDLIEPAESPYNQVASKLADLGYIVFVPHNLYRGEDRYRWLSRKANTVKGSLFSFITAQHDQILRWLETLPFVDGSRMAFYGLSYGGETAVRVPALLEKYALSICSGDFNQWTRKVASTDEVFSFMYTIEWEMPYFNMGNTFDYSELTYLIFPRPFMVERGHHDLVARDRWVAYEYAKTRRLYTQLELEGHTQMEYFNGGHAMNAEGTFEFLARHLK